MSNNLYVVGKKSLLHNDIIIYAVFPNEKYAFNFKNVFFPMADIFQVPYHSLKADSEGLSIPFASVKIK